MRSGLSLVETMLESREWNYIGCPPEIAPGWKVNAVCTFQVLICVHYIMVNLNIKYLLSVFSKCIIN